MIPVSSAILVSSSPRRKDLLGAFVPDLKVIAPKADEIPVTAPADVLVNARLKLTSVVTDVGDDVGGRGIVGAAGIVADADIIVAADTAVFIDDRVMGKPGSDDNARAMLFELSGRWHTVVSGIAVRAAGTTLEDIVETRVLFRKLSDDAISRYVDTGEPLDKAGAYGIQGAGALLVERIEGDYYNVVGLPLCRLEEMVGSMGFTLMSALTE